MTPDPVARINEALGGRYTVEGEVGRGGMASVFRAQDRRHNRAVAIKVLQPELAAMIGGERFLREIETAAQLHHPHILPVYDSGEAAGLLYYIMPLVEGESLRDRLQREGPLPIEEALRLTGEVADALAYAHERGIVHRDIKPGNILLTSGHALLADFGIARAISQAGDTALTESGLAVGTPMYMSPEQATAERAIDGRSDQYSLACVTWEMLSGAPPYAGPTAQAVIASHLSEEPGSLRAARPDVPEAVDDALHRALAKAPDARFGTVQDFVTALTGSSTRPARTKRNMTVAALAALVLFAVVVVGSELRRPEPAPVAVVAEPAVAVLPFRVSGVELDLWREVMVNLLPLNLEGIEGLRKIDPTSVMTAWNRGGSEESGVAAGTALALGRDLGARYVVTGSVVRVGDQVRVASEVLDTESGSSRGSVQVSGPADSITMLVDNLTVALIRDDLLLAGAVRPVGLERVTTSSLPALKAYLDGERAYRFGNYYEAIGHYERAIASDSAFARAYYRIGLAYGWAGGPPGLGSSYMARASELAERLPERDALLLRGGTLWNPEGISQLEYLVARYPDDAEGWAALGDRYFHVGGRALLPTQLFRGAFDRSVQLQPRYEEPYYHLIEDAFARIDSARASVLIRQYEENGLPAGECPYGLTFDLVWGEPSARARAIAALDTLSVSGATVGCAQVPLAAPPEVLDAVAGVYEPLVGGAPLPHDRDVALWRLLQVRVPRGQIALAREVLASVRGVSQTRLHAARWRIMLHLSEFPDSADAHAAASVLAREPAPTDNFWLGALAAHEARWGDLDAAANRLEAQAVTLQDEEGPSARYASAYADVLRAFAATLRGDATHRPAFEEALGRLPPASYTREQPQQYLRYTVGTWLFDHGYLQEAERYFSSFRPYDYFYTSQAELYLGRIGEALGEPEVAREHYERFVTWWEHADPELQPLREEAEGALLRLQRG